MQQLTGLDASFLAFETANSTGHVGGVSVLDPSGAPRPLTLARLTEVLGGPGRGAGEPHRARCWGSS
jgi:diacylglycerol O-acyltransferase / wax synthase